MADLGSHDIGTDRRRLQRVKAELQVKYQIRGTRDKGYALLQDLSEEGVGLLFPQQLAARTGLDLEMIFSEGAEPLHATGEIIWQNGVAAHMQPDHFATGVRLARIAPTNQNRLGDFLTASRPQPPSKVERWRFPDTKFIYEKRVVLKHTNLEGNTYYDNYVTWQGEARESLLLSHPSVSEFLKHNSNVKMITHSLFQRFIRDSHFGDALRIEVTSRDIKHCSFVLVFRFYNKQSGTLLGEGWQRICFGDYQTGKLLRIPQLILDLIEPIQESSEQPLLPAS